MPYFKNWDTCETFSKWKMKCISFLFADFGEKKLVNFGQYRLFSSKTRLRGFAIQKVKRLQWRHCVWSLCSFNKKSTSAALFTLHRPLSIAKNLYNFMQRVRHIQLVPSNINLYSSEQTLQNFCFRLRDVGRYATLIEFGIECIARRA